MAVYFGADYYPEHWEEGRIETDIPLMKEFGIDVVRLGEFSWAKMEPERGRFDFKWLSDFVNRLGEAGIYSILGTPTAAPPVWVFEEDPEIFPVDSDGIRMGFGSRHHDCQSNVTYRQCIRELVTVYASYFKDNPYVIGWQIDNELGNAHTDLCMCDSCAAAFEKWLEKKYGTISELNDAWGTSFWSQHYTSFEQIRPPRKVPAAINPSQMLDWKRFHSDLIVDFLKEQADIIRRVCPGKFVTHNMMGFSGVVDYYDLGKELDFVSHDQYPGGFYLRMPNEDPVMLSGALEVMRGVKKKTFWIMEQQAGITGTEIFGRLPAPGQLSLWTAHSIAHGADAVIYFRWRTCSFGCEEYWHGILPHDGRPTSRFYELKDCVAALKPVMGQIAGAMPGSRAAIVYSYDQMHAMEIQPHHPDLYYAGHIASFYGAFYRANIPVDFVSEDDDISGYEIVAAPFSYITGEALALKYEKFVRDGGTLLLSMRAGVKDEANRCLTDGPLPGPYSKMLGIMIEDYDCLRDTDVKIRWGDDVLTGRRWSDIILPESARVLARYDSEFYRGHAAVTENDYGKGRALYVGTEPAEDLADRVVKRICEITDVCGVMESPDGVEVTERTKDGVQYVFVLNHNGHPEKVSLPDDMSLVCVGADLGGEKTDGRNLEDGWLCPYGFKVFKRRTE